ncbi:MAG: ketoacyl-ACP synthase III [Proteobacteria bacterium]|nr:ketoacyl-ACP synthase III [Pseudomonadota bacterium]MCP4918625.1 ketoacyl-ACP synthase III [Pseudomonadota bacterium]
MLPTRIERTHLELPAQVQTAEQLSPLVGKSANWIVSRSGVAERRLWDGPVEQLGANAVRGLGLDEPPDVLINCSLTPRQLIPDTGAFVAKELGWAGLPVYSIHSTCLSFMVGLQHASALIAAGLHERIVLVAAERGSICRDFTAPESAVLIGDGAAAALVTRGEGSGLRDFRMRTYPEFAHLAQLEGCGVHRHPNDPETGHSHNLFQMSGPRLYRHGVKRMTQMLNEILGENGLDKGDVSLVVPHQASGPGVEAVRRYGFSSEQVVDVVGKYGNCIAASIPMALAHADAEGRIQRGDTVLLMGTGAGLSVATALLTW